MELKQAYISDIGVRKHYAYVRLKCKITKVNKGKAIKRGNILSNFFAFVDTFQNSDIDISYASGSLSGNEILLYTCHNKLSFERKITHYLSRGILTLTERRNSGWL